VQQLAEEADAATREV